MYVVLLGIITQASIWFFIVNIILNSYCIMTQRYNIIRINEIIKKNNNGKQDKINKLMKNNNKIIDNINGVSK